MLWAVTLSEENGPVTSVLNGTYQDYPRDQIGGRWRPDRRTYIVVTFPVTFGSGNTHSDGAEYNDYGSTDTPPSLLAGDWSRSGRCRSHRPGVIHE